MQWPWSFLPFEETLTEIWDLKWDLTETALWVTDLNWALILEYLLLITAHPQGWLSLTVHFFFNWTL